MIKLSRINAMTLSMRRERFHRTLFFTVVLAASIHARPATVWTPAKVLAMVYPREARSARIEGTVQAKCLIKEDGTVADVVILSGHPVLARSAKANLLRWAFRRVEAGKQTEENAVVTYDFKLEGNCDKYNRCNEEFWYEAPDRVTIVSELPNINPGLPSGFLP